MRRASAVAAAHGLAALLSAQTASAAVYAGDPGNYLPLLAALQPGDVLVLEAGTYTSGLPVDDLNGSPAAPIVIVGPESGPRAVFRARACCNTVSITNSSWVEIRNLELDGRDALGTKLAGIDAVKCEGSPGNSAHHVTLENLLIHDHDGDQQTVGISTKCTAWDWTIRRNVIVSAGTGMYLGDSTGLAHFVNGVIEGNLVADGPGYQIQIKHQAGARPAGPPASGRTRIRHNVLSKASNAAGGDDARPNLLVGHWPLSGAGSTDFYEIYGNFFWANPVENLFQGEGNLALYDNLFVNQTGGAVAIQAQNGQPREVRVFANTVLASATAVSVSGVDPAFRQVVAGNALFAATPLDTAGTVELAGNVTASLAGATAALTSPSGTPGASTLDLHPLAGQLGGAALDPSALSLDGFLDWNKDFNAQAHGLTRRGAYAGSGANPGWALALARKPLLNPRGADFDFDAKSDVAVFHAASGLWYWRRSTTTLAASAAFGAAGYVPLPRDYDGDGAADLAVFHAPSGQWFLRLSTTGATVSYGYGGPGYTPVPADYDGDGKVDVAVYHGASGLWFLRSSASAATTSYGYGGPDYTAVPADYDGDGRADVAAYHAPSGLWFLRSSASGATTSHGYGGPGYTAVPADYDGDGRAEVAVFHEASGLWFLRSSSSGATTTLGYGGPGYTPTPADYDGDGRADVAAYHAPSGLWFLRRSLSASDLVVPFGGPGFLPVAR